MSVDQQAETLHGLVRGIRKLIEESNRQHQESLRICRKLAAAISRARELHLRRWAAQMQEEGEVCFTEQCCDDETGRPWLLDQPGE